MNPEGAEWKPRSAVVPRPTTGGSVSVFMPRPASRRAPSLTGADETSRGAPPREPLPVGRSVSVFQGVDAVKEVLSVPSVRPGRARRSPSKGVRASESSDRFPLPLTISTGRTGSTVPRDGFHVHTRRYGREREPGSVGSDRERRKRSLTGSLSCSCVNSSLD